MAHITQENIGLLHEKIAITLSKEDYAPAFEKKLADKAKNAVMLGFRKGMVPKGIIKKQYGDPLFFDIIKTTVDKKLHEYVVEAKLNLITTPLPIALNNSLNSNDYKDYTFEFEIGLYPKIDLDLSKGEFVRYKIDIEEKTIDEEIENIKVRYGKMEYKESITTKDDYLNVLFEECDTEGNILETGLYKGHTIIVNQCSPSFQADLMGRKTDDAVIITIENAFTEDALPSICQHLGLDITNKLDVQKQFSVTIKRIGFFENAVLDEAFYEKVYPNSGVTSIEAFRSMVKEDVAAYFEIESSKQLRDQLYHYLVDNVQVDLPEKFIRNFRIAGYKTPMVTPDIDKDIERYIKDLKLSAIYQKVVIENDIEVTKEDFKKVAIAQIKNILYSQLNATDISDTEMNDYAERLMKDKKFMDENYNFIISEKVFNSLEQQIVAKEVPISQDDFTALVENHHHHH